MQTSLRALACACSLFVQVHHAMADAAPLTLEMAQHQALAHSRAIPAQDFAAMAAREMAVAAGRLPDPVLKAGVENVPVSGADRYSLGADFMTMRRISVSQEFTNAEKRRRRAERFEAEAEKEEAIKRNVAAQIRRDAGLAWVELYFAAQGDELLAALEAQAKMEIEAAQAAQRGAHATLPDVVAAQQALLQVSARRIESGRRLRAARLNLARWIGKDPSADLVPMPPIENAEAATVGHHPHLEALKREEDVARADTAIARAEEKPDWTVDVSFQQRGPSYPNMISFGISVPLQWDRSHRQHREIAARQALQEQAAAAHEEAEREWRAAALIQREEWLANLASAKQFREAILPLAKLRQEAVLAEYRGGKAALADLLAARRAELDVRLQALDADAAVAKAWVSLSYYSAGEQP
ncbi:TolC family protein [Pseudoduganella sp. RAF53_2]|uniref:TolC family protein n=1 Tax=unclassified Pseudoduganella TaxID=2637179 RepID=UPI003F99FF37